MKLKANLKVALVAGLLLLVCAHNARAQYLMEKLGRGVVAVRQSTTEVYVGWRLLGTEYPSDIGFNLYRTAGAGQPVKLNAAPLTQTTDFTDAPPDFSQKLTYTVRAVVGGTEQTADSGSFELPANAPVRQYLSVPLQIPPPFTSPDGVSHTYSANDGTVADLDGDGEYEYILKWDPDNSGVGDNNATGWSSPTIVDAYRLDGTRLWRINLGINVRAGSHYTQLLAYDFDGDGKAELALKTADGTVDGVGHVIGDPNADWRSPAGDPNFGRILNGPEYLSIFNGLTGAVMDTVNFIPGRDPLNGWGGVGGNGGNDQIGTRADRPGIAVAYLDGRRPSLVFLRGFYGRSVMAAWDWRGGHLTSRWVFDSALAPWRSHPVTFPYTTNVANLSTFSGQGNHQLSVGDFDGDGVDEVNIGSMAVDDNGLGLFSTGLRHGDALDAGDLIPARPGLEVYGVHENENATTVWGTPGAAMYDAKTGEMIWTTGPGVDVGRGRAEDIDPNFPGVEAWGAPGGLRRGDTGEVISTTAPPSVNNVVWWDSDLTRELEDSISITKWDPATQTATTLLTATGTSSNNGTKSNPVLSGDILGDWREEVIWRTSDNTALRIYTTTIPAANRIYTLMHDPQYREAVAWQNNCYNQPPHPSFFLGAGMSEPPVPNIVTTLGPRRPTINAVSADTGISPNDRITNDTTLTVSGTADPGSTVTLALVGGGVLGTTTADPGGAWSIDTNTTLPQGSHTFSATASDSNGANTTDAFLYQVTIDTTAPQAPVIASVAGGSLVFKGTAEAGSTVAVGETGGGALGTTTADGAGNWTLTYAGNLPAGNHTFTATASDVAGNVSAPSSAFSVDTGITTPVITGIVTDGGVSPNDHVTSDSTLIINGTADAGSTVTVRRADVGVVGTTTAGAGGTWSFDYTSTVLNPGTYTFTATASNGEGHNSLTSPDFVVTVEGTPPTVVSINRQNPASATTNTSAVTFRVTFSEQVSGVDASDFELALTGTATGAVSSVTSVSTPGGNAFDVTVAGIDGNGTLRLDLKAAGTGITDAAGNALAGGFNTGQSYTITTNASGAWINAASGGLWSNGANWLGGVVANGAGSTADFSTLNLTANNTVRLDSPRTVGNLIFGDTNTTTAASWTLDGNGDPSNGLALSVASGNPTVTVNALGTNATATIATPVVSAAGLTKAGPGTLVLSGANIYNGGTNVSVGTLRLGSGGSISTSTVDVGLNSTFNVAGGTVTANGLATVTAPGNLFVDAGTGNFNGGVRSSNNDGAIIRVGGGTFNASNVTIQRNSAAAVAFTSGFIVTGGTSTVGTIALGTSNSNGALSVEGGTLNVTGAVTVANQVTAGRGGALRVTNGVFNVTDTTDGIVMSRTNGTNANNVSAATFTGGVSTVEKFTLGFDNTVSLGSATITVNGGSLYVGSGGIVKKGAGTFATNINLTSGTLGAAADWSSPLNMTLPTAGTGFNIRAADAAGTPKSITLGGILSGAGGFTKAGAGTLVLGGANTYTGATNVNAGTLRVNGSLSSATGVVTVNNGGTLSGGGTVGRAVTLNSGGTVAPEGTSAVATLNGASLTWNGGGRFAFDLGNTTDRLALSGALTKGSAGTYEFVFNPGDGLAEGTTYTLATFGSTNFAAADFTYSGLPAGMRGVFTLGAGTLQFTVLDTTAPTLTLPADINVEADGPGGAVVTYEATANDAVSGSLPVTFNIPSGSAFAVGTTTVTATATDAAGNTANGSFTVTVRDTTKPQLTLPTGQTLEATGPGGAVATFAASANDLVSGSLPVTYSVPSGSTFPLGTTAVTVTATDAAGNTATGTFDIVVRDTTVPALNVPASLTLEATGPSGAIATYAASANDAVSGNVAVTFSVASGSTFALGTTTVTVTATDAAGNTASETFNVTVRDTTAPTIAPVSDVSVEATSPAGAAAGFAASASDLVDGVVNVSYSHAPGSTFPLGSTTVTVTATDRAGNTATSTFKVTVRDTTAPTLSCPADIVVTAAPGANSAAVNFNPTASDTVSGVTVTVSRASGSAFGVGTTTVNVTAKDAAGNTSTCSFNVTVKSQTTTNVLAATAQYSDAVTLQATVGAAAVPGQALTGTVQFFLNGNSAGSAPLVNGTAALPLTINSAAGVYNVTAQFTSTNSFYVGSAAGPALLTVNRENTATAYTGDTDITTAGPNVNTANARLAAHLTPEADGTGFVGDITKATVTFELFDSANMSGTPDRIVAGVPVNSAGDATATVNNLPVESYLVNVKVDGANQFWAAEPVGVGVLNVTTPTTDGRSAGAGWVADPSSKDGKSVFGFAVRYDKNDNRVKGGSTFVFRGKDGFIYVVRSTIWLDGFLKFTAEPGVTPAVYTRSNFKGRCLVLKLNSSTGRLVSFSLNHTFEVSTKDGNLLNPRQADAYAITVWDGGGQVWHQVGTRTSPVTLGGGSITNRAK